MPHRPIARTGGLRPGGGRIEHDAGTAGLGGRTRAWRRLRWPADRRAVEGPGRPARTGSLWRCAPGGYCAAAGLRRRGGGGSARRHDHEPGHPGAADEAGPRPSGSTPGARSEAQPRGTRACRSGRHRAHDRGRRTPAVRSERPRCNGLPCGHLQPAIGAIVANSRAFTDTRPDASAHAHPGPGGRRARRPRSSRRGNRRSRRPGRAQEPGPERPAPAGSGDSRRTR